MESMDTMEMWKPRKVQDFRRNPLQSYLVYTQAVRGSNPLAPNDLRLQTPILDATFQIKDYQNQARPVRSPSARDHLGFYQGTSISRIAPNGIFPKSGHVFLPSARSGFIRLKAMD